MGIAKQQIIMCLLVAIILKGETIKPRIKDGVVQEKRDYRPTKWVANSAMDVWYGNKSMIDIIAREFSDIMYKYTSRSVRATSLETKLNTSEQAYNTTGHRAAFTDIPTIEVNFLNGNNETVLSID